MRVDLSKLKREDRVEYLLERNGLQQETYKDLILSGLFMLLAMSGLLMWFISAMFYVIMDVNELLIVVWASALLVYTCLALCIMGFAFIMRSFLVDLPKLNKKYFKVESIK